MRPILRRLYLLPCSKEKIKFFCNCLLNIVSENIAMAENVSKKKLERHRILIAILGNKKGIIAKATNFVS